ncbi:hypothetical protein TDB9533_03443 [Thalassocella blandensis]|nr:hypothetical protein TDB9533_03443 [Thalassocella blandensis]
MKKIKNGLAVSCLVLGSQHAFAHTEHNQNIRTELHAYSSFTYRSDAVVEPGQSYQIPGALLGGEAVPAEKGFNFDEALLEGTLNTAHHYYISGKLSAHNSDSIELENLWLTVPNIEYLASITLEVGKINSEVSPSANWHASQHPLSESSLLGDIYFGRHFNDMGLRLTRTIGFVHLGAEVFDGDNWPATSGEGSASAFLQLDFSWRDTMAKLRGWHMQSQANNRTDTRYTGSHSHGGNVVSSPSTEYFFTGNVDTSGVMAELSYGFTRGRVYLESEWIVAESEGDIANSTQRSFYENRYEGYRVLLGLNYAQHFLTMQYEEIALQNDLLSAVTSVFAEGANLVNNGFEPSRAVVSWSYQLNPDVRVRLEGVSEKTLSEEEITKVNVGLTWQRSLLGK